MLYMFQESGGSWHSLTDRGDLVQQWVATVSATLYTEEVARSVVGALLLIASERELLPYITLDTWLWLKKQPSLPRSCPCCFYGTRLNIVKTVQGLEDIEFLKSYLVIVWSEWNATMDEGFGEMCLSRSPCGSHPTTRPCSRAVGFGNRLLHAVKSGCR